MTLTDSELLSLYDRQVRRECTWTRMRREDFPHIVRYILEGMGNGGGTISWSNLTAESADDEIEHQVSYFRGLNADFEWKVYSHDPPADLGERLKEHGFTANNPGALMVIDLDDIDPSIWTMDISHVQRVSTVEGIDAIVAMENEVWGQDISSLGRGMKYDLLNHPDHISIYAVLNEERVVSSAWMYPLPSTQFAALWGGSTLKEYRKRGYYRALLAARAREARERGIRNLFVDASPDSRPILAKNGFRQLGSITGWEWKPR